jgi:hypothetical protein
MKRKIRMKIDKLLVSLLIGTTVTFAADTVSRVQSGSKFIVEKKSDGGALFTVKDDGDVTVTGDLNMSGQKITNSVVPIADTDVGTKGYIDSLVFRVTVHPSKLSDVSTEKKTHKEAADWCSEINPRGAWRLPLIGELSKLCTTGRNDCRTQYYLPKYANAVEGSDDYTNREEEYLWTNTFKSNTVGNWIIMEPERDRWKSLSYYKDTAHFRCVSN